MTASGIEPGSEIDLAIQRGLEAAQLRAPVSQETSAVFIEVTEPPSVEVGDSDAGAGADG